MIVIEMNPRVSRSSALASKATGFPIAKIAAKLAVGYHLDEIPNDITRVTPASFEPAIDYVVVKIPRWNFEKFPQADRTLTTQMKSVGEAMAIGRTFKEAFMKGVRSLELGKSGLLFGPSKPRRRRRCGAAQAAGRAARSAHVGSLPRAAARLVRRADSRHHEDRPVVPPAVRRDSRPASGGRGAWARAARRAGAAPVEARRFWRRRTGARHWSQRGGRPRQARTARAEAGLQEGRYLRGGIRVVHAVSLQLLRAELRVEPQLARQGRHPRKRSEPHRAGDRVRLLLLSCGLCAARREPRDRHGELQPGNGVDRLRHRGPVVFPAAHLRRRDGDYREGALGRRRRVVPGAVRRADAAEACAGAAGGGRPDPRHVT